MYEGNVIPFASAAVSAVAEEEKDGSSSGIL